MIDLFSRRVVGWSWKADKTAQLIADMRMIAIGGAPSRTRCCTKPPRLAIQQRSAQWPIIDNGICLLDEPVGDVSRVEILGKAAETSSTTCPRDRHQAKCQKLTEVDAAKQTCSGQTEMSLEHDLAASNSATFRSNVSRRR